ncbi:MAG: hypothetical protein L3J98_07570 [Gammaproteobacteria bacterium]|nr:hypothetical protein [Gammaproteobacteria bacterium]MCF6260006.1 hypothetical protein [Gammaproteobacteria bacterium]
MTTRKKQVSSVGKPKDTTAGVRNAGAAAVSKKAATNEEKKIEEKPRVFVSHRVWPD